jgi:hypothetical protein
MALNATTNGKLRTCQGTCIPCVSHTSTGRWQHIVVDSRGRLTIPILNCLVIGLRNKPAATGTLPELTKLCGRARRRSTKQGCRNPQLPVAATACVDVEKRIPTGAEPCEADRRSNDAPAQISADQATTWRTSSSIAPLAVLLSALLWGIFLPTAPDDCRASKKKKATEANWARNTLTDC